MEGKSQVQSITHIIKDINTIDNCKNKLKPIDNCTIGINKNSIEVVDQLLIECSDLIIPNWKPYFARKFYTLNRDRVMVLASQARQDSRTTPPRLFSYLINKETGNGF